MAEALTSEDEDDLFEAMEKQFSVADGMDTEVVDFQLTDEEFEEDEDDEKAPVVEFQLIDEEYKKDDASPEKKKRKIDEEGTQSLEFPFTDEEEKQKFKPFMKDITDRLFEDDISGYAIYDPRKDEVRYDIVWKYGSYGPDYLHSHTWLTRIFHENDLARIPNKPNGYMCLCWDHPQPMRLIDLDLHAEVYHSYHDFSWSDSDVSSGDESEEVEMFSLESRLCPVEGCRRIIPYSDHPLDRSKFEEHYEKYHNEGNEMSD